MKTISDKGFDQYLALFLVLAGSILRLAPHPDNFTPITALAVFAGFCLRPSLAVTVPLLVMMITDLWAGPHPLFALTWGCFAAVAGLAALSRSKLGARRVLATSIGGSIFFYLVTNMGVFVFQDLYPKTFSGLVTCYVMALPFLRNELAGSLFYTALFFGVFAAARSIARRPGAEPQTGSN